MAENDDNLKDFNPNSKFGNIQIGSFNLSNSMSNWTRREYIIGGIAIGAILIVFVLAGFLGAKGHTHDNTCTTPRCIEMSAYIAYTMDKTKDPCDDFYKYACGSFAATRGIRPGRVSRTTLNDIYERNEQKLRNLLEAPTSRATEWSSEMKLKDVFNSCLDEYGRENLLGRPFIKKILSKMGGWYVLHSWEPTTFNFNTALKTVQTDLWVAAFWSNYVGPDLNDFSKNVVQLFPAGSGRYMAWSFYTRTDNQQIKDDYKKYMRNAANLIARDSKLTIPDLAGRIEIFVSDAFSMETKIAKLYQRTAVSRDRYQTSERISLQNLTSQSGNVIDWVDQMKYEFPNALTKDSKVILYKKDFFFGLSSLINNLDRTTKNRILHNYMIWRLLENYATSLSWEYIHANRKYFVDLWGQVEFLGNWRSCFYFVDGHMHEALGSLYVRDHFSDANRNTSRKMTDYIRQALLADIDDNKFLDSATKKVAKSKLAKTVYKIGYPDFMLSHDKLDNIYNSLTVNRSDYFQNVLNLNTYKKEYYDRMLSGKVAQSEWKRLATYDTTIGIRFNWNEIIMPAGILQFPLYDSKNPKFANFGSIGTVLGHYLTHNIDELGRYWSASGKWVPQSWWTNKTMSNYNKVKKCVINYYTNQTQGPYSAPNGKNETIPINAANYYKEAISIISGIKMSYRAYKKWISDNGPEPKAPALDLSNDQMFFIAHAQTYCFDRNSRQAYYNAVYGRVEEDFRTNLALSQLPEFAKAFQCKAGTKMNPPSKCGYF